VILANLAAEIAGFDDDIFRLAIAGNQIFSCAADGKLRLHSADKRELVRKFEGSSDWLISLAVDANVTHLAAGTQNGEVLIWDADNSTPGGRFMAAPGIAQDKLSQKSE
jgi:WD40 repeat protein